jgi:hypothetical protein
LFLVIRQAAAEIIARGKIPLRMSNDEVAGRFPPIATGCIRR